MKHVQRGGFAAVVASLFAGVVLFALVAPAGAQASKPDAPTITSVKSGNQRVVLTWKAPSSDGGSSITGYVVTPFRGDVAQKEVTFHSPETTATVTGLRNNAEYTFKVAAINASGTGALSAASDRVTPHGPGTKPWYQQKRFWAAGLAIVIVIAVVLYFALRKPKKPAADTVPASEPASETASDPATDPT